MLDFWKKMTTYGCHRITHVFVNDPARGYGIFIENMLDAAE